jgi:hypothetical protein
MILTRIGYDALPSAVREQAAALWLNANVLSQEEKSVLRGAGVAVTVWTNAIDPSDAEAVAEALETVRIHHSNSAIWVEGTW